MVAVMEIKLAQAKLGEGMQISQRFTRDSATSESMTQQRTRFPSSFQTAPEIEPASYTWARRSYAGMTTAQAAGSRSKTCSLLLHLKGLLGLLMRRVRWLGRRSARNGRVGWCLRTRFSARDWRDSGDIQDSNAATATGAGDGVRREPTMD
jgi:hypothetical protein